MNLNYLTPRAVTPPSFFSHFEEDRMTVLDLSDTIAGVEIKQNVVFEDLTSEIPEFDKILSE